jgi:hypothetical protein
MGDYGGKVRVGCPLGARRFSAKGLGPVTFKKNFEQSKHTGGRMMITFICSCRNNNQPTVIYPLGTFPRGLKKAHVMMLPSCPLLYNDDPFTPLVDVVVR